MLTDHIWITSLVRGPHREDFLQIWNERRGVEAHRTAMLDDLNAVPGFRLHRVITIQRFLISR